MDDILEEARLRLSEMSQLLADALREIHAGRFSFADPSLRRLVVKSEQFRSMAAILMNRMLRLEKTKY